MPQQVDKGAFRFLDLPPELRNHVYELVLESAGDLEVRLTRVSDGQDKKSKKKPKRAKPPPPKLSLFLTCSQIRSETLTLVYSKFCLSIALPPEMWGDSPSDFLDQEQLYSTVHELCSTFPLRALRSIRHITFQDSGSFRRFCNLLYYLWLKNALTRRQEIASALSGIQSICVHGCIPNEDVPLLCYELPLDTKKDLFAGLPALEKIYAVADDDEYYDDDDGDENPKEQEYDARDGKVYQAEDGKEAGDIVELMMKKRRAEGKIVRT